MLLMKATDEQLSSAHCWARCYNLWGSGEKNSEPKVGKNGSKIFFKILFTS